MAFLTGKIITSRAGFRLSSPKYSQVCPKSTEEDGPQRIGWSDLSQVLDVEDILGFRVDILGNHQGENAVRSTLMTSG
jgi:hypothetical protein